MRELDINEYADIIINDMNYKGGKEWLYVWYTQRLLPYGNLDCGVKSTLLNTSNSVSSSCYLLYQNEVSTMSKWPCI